MIHLRSQLTCLTMHQLYSNSTPKCYRSLNKIDVTRFKQDLRNSDIVTKPKTELNELVNQYNGCLSQLLDKHAPLRVKKTGNRNINPWDNENIHTAKQKFQAERKRRKDHTDESNKVMVELRKNIFKGASQFNSGIL